jgi:hypothetical protein
MKKRGGFLIFPAAGIVAPIPLMWMNSAALRADSPPSVWKVRTIYTTKLGLEHPTGLAFLPGVNAFLVLETPRSSKARISVVTPYREFLGVFEAELGSLDPASLVFDSRSGRLFAYETTANDLLEIDALPDGAPPGSLRVKTDIPAGQLGVQRARGLAVDPATGDLFVLGSLAFSIACIRPGKTGDPDIPTASGEGRISSFSVRPFVSAEPNGLAFNPANGHLYFLSPSESTLYEATTAGELVAALDLSPFGLRDPQGMVFAPSGDPTDRPDTNFQHRGGRNGPGDGVQSQREWRGRNIQRADLHDLLTVAVTVRVYRLWMKSSQTEVVIDKDGTPISQTRACAG